MYERRQDKHNRPIALMRSSAFVHNLSIFFQKHLTHLARDGIIIMYKYVNKSEYTQACHGDVMKKIKRIAVILFMLLAVAVATVGLSACQKALKKVNVVFDGNGGYFESVTDSRSQKTVELGTEVNPPNEPARTGYVFQGWSLSLDPNTDTGEYEYIVFPQAALATTTYYAIWKANDYTVSFDTGTEEEIASQTVQYGARATQPTNPTRVGYTFNGWRTRSATGSLYSFSTSITSDITLYAAWSKITYTITYVTNSEESVVRPVELEYDIAIQEPTAPTKTGYKFLGWFKENSETAYEFGERISGSFTLYARWEAITYSVKIDLDGGTAENAEDFTAEYDKEYTLPEAPVKRGHTFLRYQIDAQHTYEAGATIKNLTSTQSEEIKITAIYRTNTYSVSVEPQSGATVTTENEFTGILFQGAFTFKVNVMSAYNRSKDNMKVYYTTEEGVKTELRLEDLFEDKVYVIRDIDSNCTISIEGLELNVYNVTFNASGRDSEDASPLTGVLAEAGDNSGGTVAEAQIQAEKALSTIYGRMPSCTLAHYQFLKWEDSNRQEYTGGMPLSDDTELYAVYKRDYYEITVLNADAGGIYSVQAQSEVGYSRTLSVTVVLEDSHNNSNVTLEYCYDYTASGTNNWQPAIRDNPTKQSDGKLRAVFTVSNISAVMHLRVVGVTRNKYSITYNLGTEGKFISSDGSVLIAQPTIASNEGVLHGAKISEQPLVDGTGVYTVDFLNGDLINNGVVGKLAKEGADFDYWYYVSGASQIKVTEDTVLTGDTTLYAAYKTNSYDVKLELENEFGNYVYTESDKIIIYYESIGSGTRMEVLAKALKDSASKNDGKYIITLTVEYAQAFYVSVEIDGLKVDGYSVTVGNTTTPGSDNLSEHEFVKMQILNGGEAQIKVEITPLTYAIGTYVDEDTRADSTKVDGDGNYTSNNGIAYTQATHMYTASVDYYATDKIVPSHGAAAVKDRQKLKIVGYTVGILYNETYTIIGNSYTKEAGEGFTASEILLKIRDSVNSDYKLGDGFTIQFVAQWDVQKHEVYGVANAVRYSVMVDDNKTTTQDDLQAKHGAPTKKGYVFQYWTLSGSDEAFKFNETPITEDTELSAHFTPITFNVRIYESADFSGTYYSHQVKYADITTFNDFSPTPKKDGHILSAYIRYNANSTVHADGEYAANTDISTLTAEADDTVYFVIRWEREGYKIQFNVNGGSPISNESRTVYYGDEVNVSTSRTGFTFLGWEYAIKGSLTDEKGTTYFDLPFDGFGYTMAELASSPLQFTALWKENKYTVSYDLDDGTATGSITESEYTYTYTFALPDTPTKQGTNFLTWRVTAITKDGKATGELVGLDYDANATIKGLSLYNGAIVTITAMWNTDMTQVTYTQYDQIEYYGENVSKIDTLVAIGTKYTFLIKASQGNDVAQLEVMVDGEQLEYRECVINGTTYGQYTFIVKVGAPNIITVSNIVLLKFLVTYEVRLDALNGASLSTTLGVKYEYNTQISFNETKLAEAYAIILADDNGKSIYQYRLNKVYKKVGESIGDPSTPLLATEDSTYHILENQTLVLYGVLTDAELTLKASVGAKYDNVHLSTDAGNEQELATFTSEYEFNSVVEFVVRTAAGYKVSSTEPIVTAKNLYTGAETILTATTSSGNDFTYSITLDGKYSVSVSGLEKQTIRIVYNVTAGKVNTSDGTFPISENREGILYGTPLSDLYGPNSDISKPTCRSQGGVSYVFVGWFDNIEFTGSPLYDLSELISSTTDPTGTCDLVLTLYAKWRQADYNYNLIIDVDGGTAYDFTINGNQQVVGTGVTVDSIHISTDIKLALATKDGYDHIGWRNTSTMALYSPTSTVSGLAQGDGQEVTLKAEYRLKAHNVTFMRGDNTALTVKVDHLTTISRQNIEPTENYALYDWYEDEQLTTPFNFDNPITEPTKVYGGAIATGTGATLKLTPVTNENSEVIAYTVGLATPQLAQGVITIADKYNNIPITGLSANAFYNASMVTEIILPDTIKTIGANAFYNCKALVSIKTTSIEPASAVESASAGGGYLNVVAKTESPFKSISSIGNNSFAYTNALTEIGLNYTNSITTLADVFNPTNANVIITFDDPSTITQIERNAFRGVKFAQPLPFSEFTSLTILAANAFMGAKSVGEVDLRGLQKLSSVGESAFAQSDITAVLLPNMLTVIGDKLFDRCSALEKLVIPSFMADGVTKTTSGTLSRLFGTQSAADMSTYYNGVYYPNTLKEIQLTSEGITSIDSYAFAGVGGLEKVTLKSPSLVTIGSYAFYNCRSLVAMSNDGNYGATEQDYKVAIPDYITTIGSYSFQNCYKMTDFVYEPLDANLSSVSMGQGMLSCAPLLENLTLPFASNTNPNEVSKTSTSGTFANTLSYLFAGGTPATATEATGVSNTEFTSVSTASNVFASLKNLTLTDTTFIAPYALYKFPHLQNVTVTSDLEAIGRGAFESAELTTFRMKNPSALTQIGAAADSSYTFYNSSLTTFGGMNTSEGTVEIPANITFIGAHAFRNTKMTTVDATAANSLVTIGANAFSHSTAATSVNLGEAPSLTTISNDAFCRMPNLTDFVLKSTESMYKNLTLGFEMFVANYNLKNLTLPFVSGKKYVEDATATEANAYAKDNFDKKFGYYFGRAGGSIAATDTGSYTLIKQSYGNSWSNVDSVYIYIPRNLKNLTVTQGDVLGAHSLSNIVTLETVTLETITTIGAYAANMAAHAIDEAVYDRNDTISTKKFNNIIASWGTTRTNLDTEAGDYPRLKTFIMDDVTNINRYAFFATSKLKQLTTTAKGETPVDGKPAYNVLNGITKSTTDNETYGLQSYAFEYSGIEELTLPNLEILSCTAVFANSSLTKLSVEKLTSMSGGYIFYYSKISVIDAPLLTTIGAGYEIFNYAWGELTIETRTGEGHTPSLQALTSITKDRLFGMSGNSYPAPQLKSVYSDKLTSITGNHAFYNCDTLETVELPNLETASGSNMFNDCNNLTNVSLLSLQTINNSNTFTNCTRLASVFMPSLTKLPDGLFNASSYYASASSVDLCLTLGTTTEMTLTSATFPQSLLHELKIYDVAKEKYVADEKDVIWLPSKVTSIGANSFSSTMPRAKKVKLLDNSGLTTIDSSAFENSNVTLIDLGEAPSLTTINTSAFYKMPYLTDFVLKSTSETYTNITMGEFMFNEDPLLESVTLPFVSGRNYVEYATFTETNANYAQDDFTNKFGYYFSKSTTHSKAFACTYTIAKQKSSSGYDSNYVCLPRNLKNLTVTQGEVLGAYSLSSIVTLETVTLDTIKTIGAYAVDMSIHTTATGVCNYNSGGTMAFRKKTDTVAWGRTSTNYNNAAGTYPKLTKFAMDNVVNIGYYAFNATPKLKQVTTAASGALGYNVLNGITMSSDRTTGLQSYAFAYSGIEELTLPNLESMSCSNVFGYSHIEKFSAEKLISMTGITNFQYSKISVVDAPALKTIEDGYNFRYSFGNLAIETRTGQAHAQSFQALESIMGEDNFQNASQSAETTSASGFSYIYSDKLTSITGANAFAGCVNLTSINLPNVTNVVSTAFTGCANLTADNIHVPSGITITT